MSVPDSPSSAQRALKSLRTLKIPVQLLIREGLTTHESSRIVIMIVASLNGMRKMKPPSILTLYRDCSSFYLLKENIGGSMTKQTPAVWFARDVQSSFRFAPSSQHPSHQAAPDGRSLGVPVQCKMAVSPRSQVVVWSSFSIIRVLRREPGTPRLL